jgi:putative tryptophan/tyrosine transport system substrate-binding protein
MRRRAFLSLFGSTIALPLAARAQQSGPQRRIGVLMNTSADDPEGQSRIGALLSSLQQLGWVDGRNVRIETRWPAGDADLVRKYAAELVGLAPDVLIATSSPSAGALRQVTRSVPIVFANVIDPVGAGLVASLARPGGNITGFSAFEYSLSGKWLELLREIAPNIVRAAVLRDSALAAGIGQFAAIQALAPSSIELSLINMNDPDEMERAIAEFAREKNGCLIIAASSLAVAYRDRIISSATRYRLPNVYPFRYYPASGGLASYGPNLNYNLARSSAYVDRILKGEKPADLPVQAPDKYELVVNLKAAKALGIEVPATLLARADDVIE